MTYPLVIKTPQGFSSADVFICLNLQDAEHALQHILSSPGPDGRTPPCALLEEYIAGTEFAVNLMAVRRAADDHLDYMVTDVWIYDKDPNTARYNRARMCNPMDEHLQEICDYAKHIAQAVGIHYGAAHVELKAQLSSNDSYYTNPVMVEVGARLSGGRKATMTQAAYQHNKWDPFEALIQSHLGTLDHQQQQPPPPLHVQHLFLPVPKSGRIRKLTSLMDNDQDDLKTLHSHVWLVKEGDLAQETTDITSSAGFVWLVGEMDQVEQEANKIMSTFQLEIMEEEA